MKTEYNDLQISYCLNCKHLNIWDVGVLGDESCLLLVWCRILAAQQSWTFVDRTFIYYIFYDAPNVFCWWKVWTAGRPVQCLDSSPVKSCCCDGRGMWFNIVLLKYAMPSLKSSMDSNIFHEMVKCLDEHNQC